MTRISETELILPVLYILAKRGETSTSELIDLLTDLLHPAGEDLKILEGRNDTKFSQKVRNLVSHDTLTRRGIAEVVGTKKSSTVFSITDKGKKLYEDQKDNLASLFSFQLEKTHKILSGMAEGRRVTVLTDETMISEGRIEMVKKYAKKRSKALRDAAVKYYTRNGHIECCACSLEFSSHYGAIGKNYIEIHHLNPICEYDGEVRLDLDEAIRELRPLCANCHRVVHLHNPILSIQAVQDALQAQE